MTDETTDTTDDTALTGSGAPADTGATVDSSRKDDVDAAVSAANPHPADGNLDPNEAAGAIAAPVTAGSGDDDGPHEPVSLGMVRQDNVSEPGVQKTEGVGQEASTHGQPTADGAEAQEAPTGTGTDQESHLGGDDNDD